MSAQTAIVALRGRAEAIRLAELARMRGTLDALAPVEREAVELVTAQIVDRLLDVPALRAREAERLLPLLCELFDLRAAA